MSVYIFSLLVGFQPNGVDNAQGYRAEILKKLSVSSKYVFLELPSRRYINRYRKAGIDVEQMLSIHQYFTDNQSLKVCGKVADKLKEVKERLHYTSIEYREKEIMLIKDGFVIAAILLDEENKTLFHGIHYYTKGRLLRTEHYTDGITYTDHYVTEKSNQGLYAKMVRQSFYNQDGTVAFDLIFEEEKEWYIFPDGRTCTKPQFIAEFFKRLELTEKDTIILDRITWEGFEQPIFQYRKKARIITVLHSGHFYEKGENPYWTYLNREYYYWFKYSHMIDTMVVSTQEQKESLIKMLQEYQRSVPKIAVIPAGGIEHLRYPEGERKPYSLISVSRLDVRKKIEWIIRGVVKAHRKEPRIFIDIYGRGEEDYTKYLQNMICENHAQGYIRLMGRRNVKDVYKDYEVYISASLWETLGLSIMEAVGSGTAVIGLDVRYGNRLFVRTGENGYLVDFNLDYVVGSLDDEELIDEIADKIVEIFSDKDRLRRFHEKSYEIAENFDFKLIEDKWRTLLLS